MRQASAGRAGASLVQRWRWLYALIIGLGASLGSLDNAVNIALPAITVAFAIDVNAVQWIVICYVLTYASLLLACGRLGDVIGHKRVFLWGLAGSAVGLSLCGWATSFGWFLGFRVMQGMGIALVLSCAPALITLAFPESERSKALGLYTMLTAIVATLGPLLGGQLVTLWGWSAVFYFRVPIALLAALLTIIWVRQPVAVTPGQRFDYLGSLTLTAAIVGVLLAMNQGNRAGWTAPLTLCLGSAAVICLAICIWQELHCAEPIIELRLFRHMAFSLANVVPVLAHMASFMVLLLVPYYLLNIAQVPAWLGGLLLAMSPLGTMLAAPLGGRLVQRLASEHIGMAGLLLVSVGLWGVSQWQSQSALGLVATMLGLQGLGLGLFQVANMDFVMGMIPRHQQGVAGSLTTLTRTVGIVSGATLGSFAFGSLQARYTLELQTIRLPLEMLRPQAFLQAFQGVFAYAALVAALAAVCLWSSRLIQARR